MVPRILLRSAEETNLTLTVNSCDKNFIRGCVGEIHILVKAFRAEVISTDGATVRVKCPNIEAVNAIKASKVIEEI